MLLLDLCRLISYNHDSRVLGWKGCGGLAARVLADIKRDLDGLIGARIHLRANKGRRKVDEREGILERTYPSIFVVRLEEENSMRRVSFSYADVLTEAVELTICREDATPRPLLGAVPQVLTAN